MIFDVLTLFPGMFDSPLQESILGRAIKQDLLKVRAHNLRDWAEGKHLTTDDTPYGGGDGMVMKPEPIARAVAALKEQTPQAKVLMMTPQGVPFTQQHAKTLAQEDGLIFLCGRYEGFDERIRQTLVDAEFSLGDFVLTGGELPAMVMIDAISRYVPGVLGSEGSAETDSFSDGLLEYPQYTRPAVFEGMEVPKVLLSGDHGKIARWRREQQLLRTLKRRPELLQQAELTDEDLKILTQLKQSESQN
ncbi:tRNA (Guanine37-N(1)-) methyltransferase [Malonomonas rubra DSM 5091]|uniref:tRNA (guanine-N(1)-)-methyltransferase n=1 Tax=Malonomonas rubra DSM 5091 TaxID=1122189 RepID=A0A1M6E780_MALRU|nr:tRNA (guanosine(37)-N1)-methyltransferase TrmD [Malonomonas rubra]SHI81384.1 tRNA (Guanine37-N(1)-) methyltransferase [Malonomonas rubra DSM 5091]